MVSVIWWMIVAGMVCTLYFLIKHSNKKGAESADEYPQGELGSEEEPERSENENVEENEMEDENTYTVRIELETPATEEGEVETETVDLDNNLNKANAEKLFNEVKNALKSKDEFVEINSEDADGNSRNQLFNIAKYGERLLKLEMIAEE